MFSLLNKSLSLPLSLLFFSCEIVLPLYFVSYSACANRHLARLWWTRRWRAVKVSCEPRVQRRRAYVPSKAPHLVSHVSWWNRVSSFSIYYRHICILYIASFFLLKRKKDPSCLENIFKGKLAYLNSFLFASFSKEKPSSSSGRHLLTKYLKWQGVRERKRIERDWRNSQTGK